MKRLGRAALAGLLALGAAATFAWRSPPDPLPPLPTGDRELAWIHAATSSGAWERFVTGTLVAARDHPELSADDSAAFLGETTAVPEIVLRARGVDPALRVRWYKLSRAADESTWVRRLAARVPPPLAVIGGGSSDRAVDLARAMAECDAWPWPRPLLLLTTATADDVADPSGGLPQPLISIYPQSFRFCFTNRQMARAVVDFVWSSPELRPHGDPRDWFGLVGPACPWSAAVIALTVADRSPPAVAGLEWDDDPYSVDLSRQFHAAVHELQPGRVLVRERLSIPYSIGGQYTPNEFEAEAAEKLLRGLTAVPGQRQVLVLPTVAAPARRVLRALAGSWPRAARGLVAVTGDSINLNTVYRDADIGWDVRSLPVPLVFFAHQNPVAWDAELLPPPTATDDVLQHAELVRRVTAAAFAGSRLVGDAEQLAKRLSAGDPPYFLPSGDRVGGRGEHVVRVRPEFRDSPAGGVLIGSTVEVWARRAGDGGSTAWQLVRRLVLDHDRPAP